MKKIILTMVFLFFVGIGAASAQVPQTFNLQSLVFDTDGNITTEDTVAITVRIIDALGTVLYSEDFTDVIVARGAINLEIGGATGGHPPIRPRSCHRG